MDEPLLRGASSPRGDDGRGDGDAVELVVPATLTRPRSGLWSLASPQQQHPRPKGRLIYDQRRLRTCLPPLAVVSAAAVLVAGGVLVAIDASPLRDNLRWYLPRHDALAIGLAIIVAGVLLPALSLAVCFWAVTPSTAQRQRSDAFADALLEELLAGNAILEHYDAYGGGAGARGGGGGGGARAGTVVFMAGMGAPRAINAALATAVGTAGGLRALNVDLPAHGSLINVAFSLARAERTVMAVVDRELREAEAEAVAAAAAEADAAAERRAGADAVVAAATAASESAAAAAADAARAGGVWRGSGVQPRVGDAFAAPAVAIGAPRSGNVLGDAAAAASADAGRRRWSAAAAGGGAPASPPLRPSFAAAAAAAATRTSDSPPTAAAAAVAAAHRRLSGSPSVGGGGGAGSGGSGGAPAAPGRSASLVAQHENGRGGGGGGQAGASPGGFDLFLRSAGGGSSLRESFTRMLREEEGEDDDEGGGGDRASQSRSAARSSGGAGEVSGSNGRSTGGGSGGGGGGGGGPPSPLQSRVSGSHAPATAGGSGGGTRAGGSRGKSPALLLPPPLPLPSRLLPRPAAAAAAASQSRSLRAQAEATATAGRSLPAALPAGASPGGRLYRNLPPAFGGSAPSSPPLTPQLHPSPPPLPESEPLAHGAPTGSDPRRSMVVLVAYGASAHVAAWLAGRHPDRIAGVVVVGPVPSFARGRRICGGGSMRERLYRLRWLASLANLGVKSRVLGNAHADDDTKALLCAFDWHFGVGPSYVREARAAAGLAPLRTFTRPVLVLSPPSGLAVAAKMFSTPPARIEPARGVKDPVLATLNAAKIGRLASRVSVFSASAFAAADAETATAAAAAAAAERGAPGWGSRAANRSPSWARAALLPGDGGRQRAEGGGGGGGGGTAPPPTSPPRDARRQGADDVAAQRRSVSGTTTGTTATTSATSPASGSTLARHLSSGGGGGGDVHRAGARGSSSAASGRHRGGSSGGSSRYGGRTPSGAGGLETTSPTPRLRQASGPPPRV